MIGPDEIEEGLQAGIAAVLGLLLSTLRDLAQKGENFFGCNGSKVPASAQVITEFGERNGVRFDRVFFRNSSYVNRVIDPGTPFALLNTIRYR